jgi:hypothetical protein
MTTTIQQLVKSLGISVQEAQHEIDKFALAKYSDYFTELKSQENDALTVMIPKCVSFPLPHGDSVDIPIMTLVNHSSLSLDEVDIKMSVNTSWNPKTEQIEIDVSPIIPNEQNELRENTYNTTHLHLKFKTKSAAEGLSKHVESYYQQFKRENY